MRFPAPSLPICDGAVAFQAEPDVTLQVRSTVWECRSRSGRGCCRLYGMRRAECGFYRERDGGIMRPMTRAFVLAGCVCLIVVVLTHVAEWWQIFPGMGWGMPKSPGHYLDLVSAIVGTVLLLAVGLVRFGTRKKEPDG